MGFGGNGFVEGQGISRIVGNQFAYAVHLTVGHFQNPAHIAQHRARLQLTEGNDLGHVVAAVFVLHIADHFIPPVLAKINIEIRQGHPFWIEESLEQQAKAQWVQVGDG